MTIDRRLLAIIGRRFPAIFDVIPRGPLAVASVSRYAEVALNPQPLPPHELGAAIASEFVRASWSAARFGQDPSTLLEDLDDWCPTVPKPPRFPLWWPPIPDPDPGPEWFSAFHLGFAARLAVALSGAEGTRMEETLNQALERSLAALESSID
jgi:hypothetical protein